MRPPAAIQPTLELVRVEPDEVASLDVRDPTLGDEATDVTRLDVESERDVADAQERGTVGILYGTSSMYLYALDMCSFEAPRAQQTR